MTVATPDGRTLAMATADLHGGSYVWDDDGLVFGTYFANTAGLTVPTGYEFVDLAGAGAADPGWGFKLSADHPNAYLYVVYVAQGSQADTDTDGDGLTDAEEVQLGTDLSKADTDGDGVDDGDEVVAGTDPTDPSSAPGGGPGPGDLLARVFTCPVEYTGTDFAGDCAATEGIAVAVGPFGGEETGNATTGADGTARFDDLGVGAFVVAADLPGDALDHTEIFCAAPGDTEPRRIERNGLTSITVDLRAGEPLTCSFYIFPADAGQPKPSAAPSAKPSAGTTTLPNTGTGSTAATEADARTFSPTVGLALVAGTLLVLAGGLTALRRRT